MCLPLAAASSNWSKACSRRANQVQLVDSLVGATERLEADAVAAVLGADGDLVVAREEHLAPADAGIPQ